MEHSNGVIAIMPTGEVIASAIDEVNPKHWCCFDDIETKLNLKSNCGTDQMEHAWYLARKGIISFQVAKDICYIITSPEVEMIPPVQLKILSEIIENYFPDVEIFGIDLVSEDKHIPIIENDNYEFGIDTVRKVFNFTSLGRQKTRS